MSSNNSTNPRGSTPLVTLKPPTGADAKDNTGSATKGDVIRLEKMMAKFHSERQELMKGQNMLVNSVTQLVEAQTKLLPGQVKLSSEVSKMNTGMEIIRDYLLKQSKILNENMVLLGGKIDTLGDTVKGEVIAPIKEEIEKLMKQSTSMEKTVNSIMQEGIKRHREKKAQPLPAKQNLRATNDPAQLKTTSRYDVNADYQTKMNQLMQVLPGQEVTGVQTMNQPQQQLPAESVRTVGASNSWAAMTPENPWAHLR